MSIGIAFKAFFKALFNRDFATSVAALLAGTPSSKLLSEPQTPENADKSPESAQRLSSIAPGAVQILGLLQREGRFIDFLQEDLTQASDAQVGAVVKSTIYSGCRKALKQYLTIEPILSGDEEGSQVTVAEDFDPATIRLVGQVQGDPPFQGILRHKGWKLSQAQLPELTKEIENGVICPAEVELP